MQVNEVQTGNSQPARQAGWGVGYVLGVCEACDWRFLTPGEQLPQLCPHCFQGRLEKLEAGAIEQLAEFVRPPELYLPYTVQSARLEQQVAQFAGGLQFPPEDLTSQNLQQRMQRVYLPAWLIDAQVQADWQAEAGYNYQVKSHQESYGDGGGWKTREVMETRQRWEPRLGSLDRIYQNVTAPALEAHPQLIGRLGDFEIGRAQGYTAGSVFAVEAGKQPLVSIPDRGQQDAWPVALPRFQAAAVEECRQACGADFMREFQWTPEFSGQNWTLLLLPALTTYYLDDEKKPQPILLHGQTGKLSGVRRASMRRAQRVSLIILIVAALFFALSLCMGAFGVANPVLLPIAGVGALVALVIALGALYPVAVVWSINRKIE